uniref:EF-hand domain-containing protein n=1 Tax=Alexandrium monilatum TaxID=311494 RepID=A0A7S4QNE0_9DINO
MFDFVDSDSSGAIEYGELVQLLALLRQEAPSATRAMLAFHILNGKAKAEVERDPHLLREVLDPFRNALLPNTPSLPDQAKVLGKPVLEVDDDGAVPSSTRGGQERAFEKCQWPPAAPHRVHDTPNFDRRLEWATDSCSTQPPQLPGEVGHWQSSDIE